MRRRGKGEVCTYCKRVLESVTSPARVAATKDHIVAKAHGGKSTVWACRQCNAIKGSMTYETWIVFMLDNPEWWNKPEFRKHGLGRRRPLAVPKKRSKSMWPTSPLPAARSERQPSAVPLEYDDPMAQAAFEAVYRNRLHLLRTEE